MIEQFRIKIMQEKNQKQIAPALITGAATIGAGLINYFSGQDANNTNKKIARENLQLQREQFEYQKKLQQEIFAREDSAHQREVTDLRAAGINPLATANGGQGAAAGSVVPLTEMQNNYEAKAPQIDLSGIATAMELYEAGRSNRATENISRENLEAKKETDEANLALAQTKEENRKEEALRDYELALREQGEKERANEVHEKIQQQMADAATTNAQTNKSNAKLAKARFDEIEKPSSIQATKKQDEEIKMIKKQCEKIAADIDSQNLHDKLDTAKVVIDGAKTLSEELRGWLFGGIKDAFTDLIKKKAGIGKEETR